MAAGSKEMEIAISIAGKVEKSLGAAFGQAAAGLGSITKTAASATKSLGSITKTAASAAAKGVGAVAKVSAAATTAAASAVGGLGAAAVNVGKEFESAMSKVSATMLIDKNTAEGQKSFETLEKAARDCGASTAFSATEAAEALNYLALARYDADKAAAALPTVLKLAGAGAIDLAAASDMVTDSMSALGIDATEENLTSFADQLAQTASKANAGVDQLGEAILTVGGTASGLAGGTVELNTALGILADNGLKGAEGGTHLRNMILSLQSPTDKAAGALNGLGVEVYDAEGNMRGLNDIFKDLQGAMDGMNSSQIDGLLSTLFNKTDLTAARAMLANCTDRFDELSAAVENSAGACEDMYGIQLDNLKGDISILKSGLSDLGISVYKDLNAPLREMTQLGSSMVGELSSAYKDGGMEGMVGAVGGCLSEAVGVISGYIPQAVDMGVAVLESFIGGIADSSEDIAGAAIDAATAFVDGMFTVVPQALLAGADILLLLLRGIDQQLPQLLVKAADVIRNLGLGLSQKLPDILQTGIDIILGLASGLTQALPTIILLGAQAVTGLISGIGQRLPEIADTALLLVQTLVNGVMSHGPEAAAAALQLINGFIAGMGQMLPSIIQAAAEIVLTLIQGIAAALPSFIDSAVQAISCFVDGLIQALPAIIQGALLLVQSLVDAIIQAAPALLTAAVQLVGNLILGVVQALPQLVQMGIQLILSLAQGFMDNLPLILQMGTQIIVSLVSSITQSLPYLIQGGFQLIISLVRGIIQNLPAIVQAAITIILSLIGGLVTAIPQLIEAALSLPFVIVDAILTTNWLQVGLDLIIAVGKGIIDGALSIGDSIMNTIKGWFGGGNQEASDKGATVSQSFAAGIEGSAPAASGAASALSSTAFSNMDTSGAAAAGVQAGAAFSAGLTDNMAAGGLDTAAFSTNMTNIGSTGAAALGTGLSEGLEDTKVDTSALTADLTAIGADGTEAISTGMKDNAQTVTAAAAGLGDDVNAAFDTSWKKTESSAQDAMKRLTEVVTTAAQQAAQAVKAAFEGMEITIPKPKIPVISVAENAVQYGGGGNVSVPQFSVAWHASGGVFERPTIFSTPAGFQGAGEAGPEAILPLDILWEGIRDIVSREIGQNGNVSMIEALLRKIEDAAGGGGRAELAGTSGVTIQYSPNFNLYGAASKQEVVDAEKISREEFAKMMKRWEQDNIREKFWRKG